MITPWDDYPVHQTAMPVATPVSGDPNHYDRYFFNGFDPDGEFYFGVALGIYPNRGVIDGAFSVVRDGIQIMLMSTGGTVIKIPVEDVKRLSRSTQGVIVMRLREGEHVSTLAPVVESETPDDEVEVPAEPLEEAPVEPPDED